MQTAERDRLQTPVCKWGRLAQLCMQAREQLDHNVEVNGKKDDPARVLHCYDSDGATYFA
jgi:hypothetical protein